MHVFITGVSSGIGFAFLKHFLSQELTITAIGRNQPTIEGNYSFLNCDLADKIYKYTKMFGRCE